MGKRAVRAHARPRPLHRRRWFVRLVALLAVAMALASSLCLVIATRPGPEGFVAKAADFARDHGLAGPVTWLEERYYSWTAPPKGGVPDRAITIAPATSTSTTTTSTSVPVATTTTLPPRPHSDPPADVAPLASPPVANEGVWYPIGPVVDGFPSVMAAQLRPDAEHTSVLAGLVWIDPRQVRLQVIPGIVEPGGDWQVRGSVPAATLPALVGAFNGGFRFKDAHGGFFHEGREEHQLQDGAASFVVHTDGTADVARWNRDLVLGPTIATVRQNLSLIVDGGRVIDGLDSADTHEWGNTLGNRVLVWRSGVGVRPDGTIVYAASNGLSAFTLARLLAQAGCVRGMELDINPEWVTYDVFTHPDPGNPPYTEGAKLLPDMQRPGDRFLGEESRDFVALYLR